MGEDITTGGPSFSKEARPVWPTGKGKPVAPTPEAAKGPQSAEKAAAAAQAAEVKAAIEAMAAKEIARKFSPSDLSALLLSQNIPDTEANQRIATFMLRYGVEASKANINKLIAMVGGDLSQSTLEAALLLLMRGVETPAAVKTLSKFLSENPQLASQLSSLSGNVSDLIAALSMGKGKINDQLLAKITAVLSQFTEELENVPGKYKFSGKGSMGRAELASNLRALKSLLEGMPERENLPNTPQGQVIDSTINAATERLDQMIQNITSQALLSSKSNKGEDNFVYYQIPNAMTKPLTTVDLIIKRSDSEGGKKIDPKDTQLIMSLDTINLGRIAVKMIVKDKNVSFLFNTQNDDIKSLIMGNTQELAASLAQKDYSATKFDIHVNPPMCTIDPSLMSLRGTEDLMWIDVRA